MDSDATQLREIGQELRQARLAAKLTQQQVADLAGIARLRYGDIENGTAAARATTLINIARALGLELLLVPQAMVPAIRAFLHPHDDDDIPAFITQPDGGNGERS